MEIASSSSNATAEQQKQQENPPSPAPNVVEDLLWLKQECESRCLFEASRWASEQLSHLPETHIEAYLTGNKQKSAVECSSAEQKSKNLSGGELSSNFSKTLKLDFVRTLILNKEFRRAKFYLQTLQLSGPCENFLYFYAWYLIHLKNRLEAEADDPERREEFTNTTLTELRHEIEVFFTKNESADCFLYYLLGLIRKDSGVPEDQVRDTFRKAVELDVRCWPAFDALSAVSDTYYAASLENTVGTGWQCLLYAGETLYRQQRYSDAIAAYTAVARLALGSSPYLNCQIASAHSEMQEHDVAIRSFGQLHRADPYRIEQMNLYSDSLFIRTSERPEQLANVAKWFYESHKYHWVTCCIVANYYSARKGHDMAQEFLKRAIRLCPDNASIWVLLGHEFMETHNHQAAISSYRKAIVIDTRCYRGWYGLGQLYEILKQPTCAMYHYQQAHRCRPADSRILIALGVVSQKIGKKSDAEKLFKKAFQVGDVEGNALTHLAKLYEEKGDFVNTAKAYESYLIIYTEELVGDLNLIASARRFLARYYLELGDLDAADEHAQRCLEFEQSKEEGMRILRLITNRRSREKAIEGVAQESTTSKSMEKEGASTSASTISTGHKTPRNLSGGSSHKPRKVSLSDHNEEDDEEEGEDGKEGGTKGKAGANSGDDDDMDMVVSDGDDDDLEVSF